MVVNRIHAPKARGSIPAPGINKSYLYQRFGNSEVAN